MKKLIIILSLLFTINVTFGSTYTIHKKSTIEVLDEEYSISKDWNKVLSGFMKNNTVYFNVNDWIYVVSYEPLEEYENCLERRLYLYCKNIVTNSDWRKANPNPMAIHCMGKREYSGIYADFNPYSYGRGPCWVSKPLGTGIYSNVFWVMMGTTVKIDYPKTMTRPYVFTPNFTREDGSIAYEFHRIPTFPKNMIYRIEKQEDNIITTTDGCTIITIIENKRIKVDGNWSDGRSFFINGHTNL
jgi:hypothetical protein